MSSKSPEVNRLRAALGAATRYHGPDSGRVSELRGELARAVIRAHAEAHEAEAARLRAELAAMDGEAA